MTNYHQEDIITEISEHITLSYEDFVDEMFRAGYRVEYKIVNNAKSEFILVKDKNILILKCYEIPEIDTIITIRSRRQEKIPDEEQEEILKDKVSKSHEEDREIVPFGGLIPFGRLLLPKFLFLPKKNYIPERRKHKKIQMNTPSNFYSNFYFRLFDDKDKELNNNIIIKVGTNDEKGKYKPYGEFLYSTLSKGNFIYDRYQGIILYKKYELIFEVLDKNVNIDFYKSIILFEFHYWTKPNSLTDQTKK